MWAGLCVALIEISGVTKKYGGFTAIDDISCCIGDGAICGLTGCNGAGKTTLLKCMCGVLKPEKGDISIDGQPVYDNENTKSRIFFIPDDPYILPQASMKRMAKFYSCYYPRWDNAVYSELVGMFTLDESKKISSFSKGMLRQAFLIFALSVSAEYILMDETFDGLDQFNRGLARQLLRQAVAGRGASVIISSHDLPELDTFCDQLIQMNGKNINHGIKHEK